MNFTPKRKVLHAQNQAQLRNSYVCHDAPVVVFQADTLARFLAESLRLSNPPWVSEIDFVHEDVVSHIWNQNPGMMTVDAGVESPDDELRTFAESLDPSFLIADLRRAKVGEGFSWGRFGADTVLRRHGEARLFAYRKPDRKPFFKRFFGISSRGNA